MKEAPKEYIADLKERWEYLIRGAESGLREAEGFAKRLQETRRKDEGRHFQQLGEYETLLERAWKRARQLLLQYWQVQEYADGLLKERDALRTFLTGMGLLPTFEKWMSDQAGVDIDKEIPF
jgi:hypothetical protein